MDRPADRAGDAHPRVAGVRAPPDGALDAAGGRDDLHQLPRALPAARGGRRRRRRDPVAAAARQAGAPDHRADPGDRRQARHQQPGRQRRHHRHRGLRRPALHRHQLGRLAARLPAGGVAQGRRGTQPGHGQTLRRRRPAGPGRRGTGLARRLRVRHRRRQLDRRPDRPGPPRPGPGAARRRRLRPGGRRGLPDPAVRADAAARRRPAPPRRRGGGADRGGRLRGAQDRAQRLPAGRRGPERLWCVRHAHRAAAVVQLHGEAAAVLRRVDRDAVRRGEAAGRGGPVRGQCFRRPRGRFARAWP